MHPLKSPGPDDVLNNGKELSELNHTFIGLIPKCKNSKVPKDFWPISMCNVVMKLVTKTIANHIKHILPDIIDTEQSTLVGGRLITNNALLAMECFHWMIKKKVRRKGTMALDLDMSKAYDRL
ncbi:unnamed protein product [Vicia faba]|uniref:Reverse transcriptase n=1 Tax=Vicia faba TaxID=3906 RepID=A0AAV1ARG9_VICFA|nr:unnamed protein product [Vicia faba]